MQGQWALPGGFVDENEPLDHAAARELKEETSLDAAQSGVVLEQVANQCCGLTQTDACVHRLRKACCHGQEPKGMPGVGCVLYTIYLHLMALIDHSSVTQHRYVFTAFQSTCVSYADRGVWRPWKGSTWLVRVGGLCSIGTSRHGHTSSSKHLTDT